MRTDPPGTADQDDIEIAAGGSGGASLLERDDLPEPLPLRRVLGPSLVLLAVGLGSSEFVLWPFVSSRVGLGLIWIAVIGLATQFFVNMEIERYTLATGETVIAGFTRMWAHWAWIFLVLIAISWVWPGWVVGASTVAGFVFGWQPDTVATVSVLGLVAIGIALSVSPVVYRAVERMQWVLVGWVVAFAVVAAFLATDLDTWATIATDFNLQLHPDLSPPLILGLLVFAGAGGTLNLALSNWVRDKGMGMGARLMPLESPLTGHPTRAVPVGQPFRDSEENLRRWQGWWRVANQEHLLLFFLLGLVIIATLSALSTATVFGLDLGQGLDFIRAEGRTLGEQVGPWFRNLFWVSGAVILFSTNLGILDHLGRLIADILKVNWLADRDAWSESKLYVSVVWGEIAAGSVILLFALDAPLVLMVIAAALGGVAMLIYSALLIRLNRSTLPGTIRLKGLRLWAMIWSVILFAGFSFFVIWTGVAPAVTGGAG
ncbi:MAG TPA: Nramp family divalent metal transporter [Acidimicrobiia bacterium]